MAKIITYKALKKSDACQKQLRLFRRLFGDKVSLTKTNLTKHYAKFDLWWLQSSGFMTRQQMRKHERLTDAAYKVFTKTQTSGYYNYEGPEYKAYRLATALALIDVYKAPVKKVK